MKTLKNIILAVLVMYGNASYAQGIQIGHRNANNQPVLDVTQQQLKPTISSTMTQQGYILNEIVKLSLDDVVTDPTYHKNLEIFITGYKSGTTTPMSASFYFTLSYNATTNKYMLDRSGTGLPGVQNGGKITCSAENCKGCKPYKGEKGEPNGCSDCLSKVDESDNSGPTCTHKNGSSGNADSWMSVLGSVIIALIGLF